MARTRFVSFQISQRKRKKPLLHRQFVTEEANNLALNFTSVSCVEGVRKEKGEGESGVRETLPSCVARVPVLPSSFLFLALAKQANISFPTFTFRRKCLLLLKKSL